MADIILHHYPQSPVTEKVRIGLGIKRLAWRSVEVPRIPPKPDLMPLTGGYRHVGSEAVVRAPAPRYLRQSVWTSSTT